MTRMPTPVDPRNPFEPPKAAVLEAASGAEGGLILEGRKVTPGRGRAWWGEAWELYKGSPGLWTLMFIVFMVLMLLMAIIPLGSLVSYLLYPVFFAGIMLGCRSVEEGQPLGMGHLFAGFKQANTGSLVMVGLLYIVGLIVVTIVAIVPMLLFIPFIAPTIAASGDADPGTIMALLIPLTILFVLLIIALSLPLIMALWFAPALVVFHGLQPMAAMKASFMGCLRNFVPFLVYGVVGLGLFILAMIPLGLGLLVASPVLWATMYTGYQDIFLQRD